VLWDAAAGVYDCPCHQARFDAHGRPVFGPALLPLRDVRVVIEGSEVLAGEP
jgi:Rieske Fe-S protein